MFSAIQAMLARDLEISLCSTVIAMRTKATQRNVASSAINAET